MEEAKPIRVKLSGLWKNETKNGVVYYSGTLGYKVKLEVWPNTKRPGSKDPDFQVFVVPEQNRFEAKDQENQVYMMPGNLTNQVAEKILAKDIEDVPF